MFKRTGDWNKFEQKLTKLGEEFKTNVRKATTDSCHTLVAEIKGMITKNSVQPPTSPKFREWKIKHGHHEMTLDMTGSLVQKGVSYELKDFNHGVVGVKRGTEGKGGDLVNLAAVMEFGSPSRKIPARPFVTPAVKNCQSKIIDFYREAILKTFKT